MKKLSFIFVLLLVLVGCSNKQQVEGKQFSIYSMTGPTSMGLVKLLDDSDKSASLNTYTSTIVVDPSEVTAALVGKKADIVMLPANVAATLYNKNPDFQVVAINTLGVLYIVENGNSITSIQDLVGKKIYLTGQGSTPEYSLRYLLDYYNITDQVTLEFVASANEAASYLASDLTSVALLPEPFVTSAMMQNDKLRIALSLSDEWKKTNNEAVLVTAVTLVNKEVLAQYPKQVDNFLKEYAASINWVNENKQEASLLIEQRAIIGKAKIAEVALANCNLVCITGDEMKAALENYYSILLAANSKSIGDKLPDAAYYYLP